MTPNFEVETRRILRLYERKILLEQEAVNGFLYCATKVVEVEAMKGDAEQTLQTIFLLLPFQLQTAVRAKLNELKNSDFKWYPPVLGPELSADRLEQISGHLKWMEKLRVFEAL
ncbi:MAG: hypothetical protein JW818_18705 [Pirellulales bacterium]|nr:hypothetical protein [Pirellulales bacterium]